MNQVMYKKNTDMKLDFLNYKCLFYPYLNDYHFRPVCKSLESRAMEPGLILIHERRRSW